MQPGQIVPSRATAKEGCFASIFFRGYSYLAYSTLDAIIIVSQFTATEQLIPLDKPGTIKSISWNSITGTLVVLIDATLSIFLPQTSCDKQTTTLRKWILVKQEKIENNMVQQIAWFNRTGQLLVCGTNIEIWQFPYNLLSSALLESKEIENLKQEKIRCIWKCKVFNTVQYCSTSPDCRYFATASYNDRLPKVWYPFYEEIIPEEKSDDLEEYRASEFKLNFHFNYLPHPRAVTSLQWRHGRKKISKMQNILLTNCADGLGRCWSENSSFSFSVCSVITGEPGYIYNWLQYHPFLFLAPEMEDIGVGTEAELKKKLSEPLASTQSKAEHQNEDIHVVRTSQGERFASGLAHNDSGTEWIISIEKERFISFWKLSGIHDNLQHNAIPLRNIPNLSLWFKTKVSRAHSCQSPLHLIPSCQEVSEIGEPSNIVLQLQNHSGDIYFWDLMITNSDHRTADFRSCFRLHGHRGAISNFSSHPSLPLLCSTSVEEAEVLLWKISDSKFLEVPRLLLPKAFLPNTYHLIWISIEFFMVLCSAEVHLYRLLPSITNPPTQSSPDSLRSSPASPNISSASTSSVVLLESFPCVDKKGRSIRMDSCFLLPNFHPTLHEDTQTFSLLSLDHSKTEMHVWSLRMLHSDKGMKTSFSTCHSLSVPSHQAIECITICKDIQSDMNEKERFSFITGGCDGQIRCYTLQNDCIVLLSSFQAHQESKKILQIHCPSLFSIVTLGSNGEENTLEIRCWERFSHFPSFTLENIIVLPVENEETGRSIVTRRGKKKKKSTSAPVPSTLPTKDDIHVHFDVLSLCNGKSMIAVSVQEIIYLFHKRLPTALYQNQFEWIRSEATYTLPNSCTALHWESNGTLFASSLSHLFVFTPWVDLAMPLVDVPRTSIQQATSSSDFLPPFHPKVLIQFLLAAHFNSVSLILFDLLHTLSSLHTNQRSLSVHELTQPLLSSLLTPQGDYSTTQVSDSFTSEPTIPTPDEGPTQTAASLFGGAPNASPFVSQASALFSPAAPVSQASALFSPAAPVSQASSLFTSTPMPEESQEEGVKEEEGKGEAKEEEFTLQHAEQLNELLSSIQIQGMSSRDQMFLIVVISTFIKMKELKEGLDECGRRFILYVKLSQLLHKTSKSTITLSPREFVWAMHCEATEALLHESLPTTSTWSHAQSLGIGFWLTNPLTLREVIKNIAKAEFALHKSAEDAAIFYIALGQKSTLLNLFKATGNKKVADFLLHDFTLERWKTAATKNAYALLGRHQYRYAAAFFLLAGSIKNAVGICVKHLKDFNLPLVFTRLLGGDTSEHYKDVLISHILPYAEQTSDIWLSCASFWLLKRYDDSLSCLIPLGDVEDVPVDDLQVSGSFQMSTSLTSSFGSSTPLRESVESWGSSASADSISKLLASDSYVSFDPALIHLYREISKKPFIPRRPSKELEIRLVRKCIFSFLSTSCPILALQEIHYALYLEREIELGHTTAAVAPVQVNSPSSAASLFGGASTSSTSSAASLFGGGVTTNSTSYFGGNGGLGNMMMSFSDSDDDDDDPDPMDDKEDVENYFKTILYPIYMENAVFGHLCRVGCSVEDYQSTFDYLEKLQLHVNKEHVQKKVMAYYMAQNELFQVYSLVCSTSSIPDDPMELLRNFVTPLYDLIPLVKQRLCGTFQIPPTQVRNLLNRSRETYKCLCHHIMESNESVSDSHVSYILNGIFIGFFFSAWNHSHVPSLLELLSLPSMIYPFPKPLLDSIEELWQTSLSYETEQQLVKSRLLEIDIPPKKLEGQRFITIFLRTLLAHALHKIKQDSACVNYFIEMKLIQQTLVQQVRITPFFYVEPTSTLAQTELSPKQKLTEIFQCVIKYSEFKDDAEVKKLFNVLFRMVGKNVMSQFPAFSLKVDRETKFGDSGRIFPSFPTTTRIYKDDHGLLYSFCIHPLNGSHIIIANMKGIREIEVNSIRTSAETKQKAILETVRIVNKRKKSSTVPSPSGTLSSLPSTPSVAKKIMRTSTNGSDSAPSSPQRGKGSILALPTHSTITVTYLLSHPKEPYYLSGSANGEIYLWLFHHTEAIAKYKTTGTRVSKLHFNNSGTKFGYCDWDGVVSLYRFLPNLVIGSQALVQPFWKFKVHKKWCGDFAFLNSGSWIAACGNSKDKQNLSIWDVLLPPNRSRIASFECHEDGGSSLVYSPVHQLLISGGKSGDLFVVNVRKMAKVRSLLKAHDGNIQTLKLDEKESILISGSTDGNMKAWTLPGFECLHTWTDAHPQQTFVRPELLINPGSAVFTKGVMHIVTNEDHIYSCGADGILCERPIHR